MPSVGSSSNSGNHPDDQFIPILSFDQLANDNETDTLDNNPKQSSLFNSRDIESEARGDRELDVETVGDVDDESDNQLPAVSTQRLYLMVCADFGLAFTWLCKFAVATPYFQHSLKAGAFLSHLVWIMGPLSGLIVAPVIGVLSDRCTLPLGRRRPFIILGTVFCIVGMMTFANVLSITKGQLFFARILAVLAFGVLDFSTNVIMFPSRALLGDLLPRYQQHDAQSAAAVIASIAEICAGAYIYSLKDAVTHISSIFTIASILLAISCMISVFVCKEVALSALTPIPLTTINIPANGHDPQQSSSSSTKNQQPHSEPLLHSSSNIVNVTQNQFDDDDDIEMLTLNDDEPIRLSQPTSASPKTVIDASVPDIDNSANANTPNRTAKSSSTPSPPAEPTLPPLPQSQSIASQEGLKAELMKTIGTALKNFPRALIRVGVVYGLAWFVWFASLPFYSQWIGADVLGGDAHAAPGSVEASLYQQGVQIFSIANMVKAITALVFAAFYPTIITCVGNIGERVVFSSSFFVFSSVLFLCANTKDKFVAAFVVAVGAIPFIVTQTIPIAIVVQRYPQNLASNLGVMNLFCVIPQLVDTLYTGKVAELAGESVVLKVAAGWGLATAIAALLFL